MSPWANPDGGPCPSGGLGFGPWLAQLRYSFFSDSEDGHCMFAAPRPSESCRAVLLKDALNPNLQNAWGTVRKLHLNWGHAAPNQLKRILADAGSSNKVVSDMVR